MAFFLFLVAFFTITTYNCKTLFYIFYIISLLISLYSIIYFICLKTSFLNCLLFILFKKLNEILKVEENYKKKKIKKHQQYIYRNIFKILLQIKH